MSGNQPILPDADISLLLSLQKPVEDEDWRGRLFPPGEVTLTDFRARVDLGDLPSSSPMRGRMHLYSRRNLDPAVHGDWSVGLVYTDYAEHSYRVLRCNGPHPTPHTNRLENVTFTALPHIHRLTERYQAHKRTKGDGYAEPTDAYSSMEGALEHLATLVNLTAAGRLFL